MERSGEPGLEDLKAGEVHVWLVEPERWADDATVAACERLLSPDERAQCTLYRFEDDRQRYRASHALVRSCLSRYTGRAPESWTFVVNAHGRPDLPPDSGLPALSFNLSHTHGLAACAVALDVTVGVDVEFVHRRSATTEIADRFFAEAEVAALRALPQERQKDRFFDYWTLKESYIKGRGKGLAIPLGKFAFTLSEGKAPTLAVDPSLEDDASAWQFAVWSPNGEHRAAVAVQRGAMPPRTIRTLDCDPFARVRHP